LILRDWVATSAVPITVILGARPFVVAGVGHSTAESIGALVRVGARVVVVANCAILFAGYGFDERDIRGAGAIFVFNLARVLRYALIACLLLAIRPDDIRRSVAVRVKWGRRALATATCGCHEHRET